MENINVKTLKKLADDVNRTREEEEMREYEEWEEAWLKDIKTKCHMAALKGEYAIQFEVTEERKHFVDSLKYAIEQQIGVIVTITSIRSIHHFYISWK